MKPPTESSHNGSAEGHEETGSSVTEDTEVAEWVKDRLKLRQQGQHNGSDKPALHAVALDAVPGSPLLDDPSTIFQG